MSNKKVVTSERVNEIINNAIKWSYIYDFRATDDTVVTKAQKIITANYPDLFGDKIGEAKTFVDKTATEYATVEGTPERKYDSFIDKINGVIKSNLAPFMIIDVNETKVDEVPPYEEETEKPEQSVVVDNKATDSDNNMAKVDFGFGTSFDPDQINKEMAEQFDPSNPARAFLQQPTEFQQPMPQMMPMYFQQQPMMQPNYNHQQVITNYNPNPIHRIDEAPKPKKTPPAEDKVDHNLEKIQIDALKKDPIVKQQPEIIQPLEAVAPVDNTVVNMYDNSEIANKYTKVPLLELQAIANQNGCSVKFEEYPHEGIISVATFDHMVGQPVAPKSFCIDTGMIIDKRAKLIATNPVFNPDIMLEQAQIYELFSNAPNSNKKVLDTKMINDIFVAGLLNITKKEMYSESYKSLNMKLALITLPTKGLNKEERNSLQDYIVKMDHDGYLDKAIQMAPGSRFVFVAKQLAKNALADFVLINQGVPRFYGTEPLNVMPVIIESKAGKITIRTAVQQ